MATGSKLSARAAIAKVLGDAKGKSMKVPAIIEKAVPLTNLGGKTPGQTIYSVLYSENKKKGNARQFVSTGRGEFKLNPSFAPTVRTGSGSKSKAAPARKSAARKTTARKSSAARKTAPRKRSSAKSGAAA